MARFYDTTEGSVLIDGMDVRDYTFESLYNKIAYITQKPVLFAGSIRENIDFGVSASNQTDDTLLDALELAQAGEFIAKVEGGLDYQIAQNGRNVSGGQRQRLSIARALARKAEIIVFDDSFSALDYETDAKLRAGINTKLKGTTCVIVAQRIGTIRHVDKIVVLDNGRAVGMGTHDELIKNCEVYREIALSQMTAEEVGA